MVLFLFYLMILFSGRNDLAILEADRQYMAESIVNQCNVFTSEEISAFFDEYTASFRRAKSTADRNMRRFTSKRARSHTTCWDVIKRLRRADGTLFIF